MRGVSRVPGDPFYRSPEWRGVRAAFLAANPVCGTLGCGRRAHHVDHRLPIRRGGARLDPANFRQLCAPCHASKTARMDGGFGNAPSPRGAGVDGWPTSPAHRWNARGAKR